MALTALRYEKIDVSLHKFSIYLLVLLTEMGEAEPTDKEHKYAHQVVINTIGQIDELRSALQHLRDSRGKNQSAKK
jgi:hypothetical protein